MIACIPCILVALTLLSTFNPQLREASRRLVAPKRSEGGSPAKADQPARGTGRMSILIVALALFVFAFTVHAQGTAFTYQGRLNTGSNAAAGSYDLRFAIYDSAGAGTLIAGPLTNSATGVTNGLFTVTLDFGTGAFSGAERWLELGVQTNGGAGFVLLSPRQQLTAAPYAIRAGSVNASGISGPIADNQLSANIAR